MAKCGDYIKKQFPLIDDELKEYVTGSYKSIIGTARDNVFWLTVPVSLKIQRKSMKLEICEKLLHMLQPNMTAVSNGPRKVLDAPIHLASMKVPVNDTDDLKSIWLQTRDDSLKVDARKLEKAEAKLQQKLQKAKDTKNTPIAAPVLQTATASQTTLLRMIAAKQLKIPSHISILHVEQEVVGDDTLALQLETIEADKAPAKASIILSGLGFNPDMQARATRTFSGGWRMRLALARALFSKPDLLLLDEPTNMLDIKAIIWLENYLQNWPTTLLVVSHDRNFLDTNQQREFEAQQQHRAHTQEFIDRFRYNANRASSVQSKIKMLDKLEGSGRGASVPRDGAALTAHTAAERARLLLLQGQGHIHQRKTVEEYRRQLGSFGVSGDMALQTIASLSGGQKSRVAFSRMCMGNPNFLVLDEPTNHLDIETIEALGKGINKYNGGVILVSHDERLIRMVCKELWVCGNGSVESIEGGFDEYRKIVERELEAQNK
ncbi:ATP-binding cassette sub-family F member 3-like protein [Operophtera brumata]|uniref:ATP-binding cassette sub-family F member 3-like protein n=1 Tax=Operophtera brumata TaxID=104452 RepID=A0A0L7LMW9_OPEBR|nr:ATP-binding cassette sub-family F member 3-like protein [Operophtera brumata]